MTRKRVLLPAPFLPMTPIRSPAATESSSTVKRLEVVVDDPPLDPADRVLLEGTDALPRDPVPEGDLVEADDGHPAQLQ